MKVLLHAEYQCLVFWNLLNLVAPFPCDFDGRLNGLGTSVHRQHHVEVKKFGHEFGEAREDIVVECSAAERQAGRLLCECLDQLRVAMALVHRAIG